LTKKCASHQNGRDFEKKYFAALNTIIIYGPMVNDFELIQPFGGNRVPIDEGRKIIRKSQKELSDLNIKSRLFT
jgi:hypothetical protein